MPPDTLTFPRVVGSTPGTLAGEKVGLVGTEIDNTCYRKSDEGDHLTSNFHCPYQLVRPGTPRVYLRGKTVKQDIPTVGMSLVTRLVGGRVGRPLRHRCNPTLDLRDPRRPPFPLWTRKDSQH